MLNADPLIQVLSSVETWTQGTELRVATDEGLTVMQVHIPGEEPEVDILETPEGITIGPLMRFLGSVASRESLLEGQLESGLIMSTYKIVLEANNQPFLLSGKVITLDVRQGKPRKL